MIFHARFKQSELHTHTHINGKFTFGDGSICF